MKKKVLFAAVASVLAVVLVVLPWVLGRYSEATFRKMIAANIRSNSVSVQLESYQRGWFTSTAVLSMKVVDPGSRKLLGMLYRKDGNPLDVLTVTERIVHGPFAYATWDGPTPVFRPVLGVIITAMPAGQAGSPMAEMHISGYALLDITGGAESHITVPNWHWTTAKHTHINWDGMQIDAAMPVDFGHMHFTGRIGTLTISGADVNVSVAGAHLQGGLHLDKLGQWIGSTRLTLSNIGYGDAVNTLLSLHDIDVHSAEDEKDQLLDTRFVFDAGGGQVGDFVFNDARYGIRISHLDEKALKSLQKRMRTITSSGQQPLVEDFLSQIDTLLKGRPVVMLTPLHLASVDGALDAQLEIHLAPVDVASANDLLMALRKADTDAKLNISKALAVRLLSMAFAKRPGINAVQAEILARRQLDKYVQSGVLKEGTTAYSLKYHHDENVTTLNGHPVGRQTGV